MRPPKNGWSKDRKYFNGKPIAHWEAKAKEQVIYTLVRAGFSMDTRSIVGEMASKQLLGIAMGIDRVMVEEVVHERDRCREGLQEFLTALLPDPPKKRKTYRP